MILQTQTAAPVGAGNGGKYYGKPGGNSTFPKYLTGSFKTRFGLEQHGSLDWPQFSWLMKLGIPAPVLVEYLDDMHIARGIRANDGYFEPSSKGRPFVMFDEGSDLVFWSPRTGELATWHGRAFALGESNIMNAGTYGFDRYLKILPSPVEWLSDRRNGAVVMNWNLAFDLLRDVPRIAVAESLLPTYRKHMKPRRMPTLAVLANDGSVAA